MKDATRSGPPEGWKPPSGLCECGCGGKTSIVEHTARTRGQYAGYPLRFIHGHHARLLSGEKSSRWKGGRITLKRDGYILIRVGDRYRPEHVLKWEKHRGPVPQGWVVHHLNHDRTDNRISNLLCMTRAQHKKLHEEHDRTHKTGHYSPKPH